MVGSATGMRTPCPSMLVKWINLWHKLIKVSNKLWAIPELMIRDLTPFSIGTHMNLLRPCIWNASGIIAHAIIPVSSLTLLIEFMGVYTLNPNASPSHLFMVQRRELLLCILPFSVRAGCIKLSICIISSFQDLWLQLNVCMQLLHIFNANCLTVPTNQNSSRTSCSWTAENFWNGSEKHESNEISSSVTPENLKLQELFHFFHPFFNDQNICVPMW